MNKKIYFNNKFISLETPGAQYSQDQDIKTFTDITADDLKRITDEFLDGKNKYPVKIIAADTENLFESLKKIFFYIEAAGGFIENDDQYLFIHRHGRWDLPKGKLEKGETVELAAVRECEEECGVRDLTILKALTSTYHLYPYKTGHALKRTYWFYMKTSFNEKLKPQLEEDIDEVKWFGKKEIVSSVIKDTYFTITDVIREALDLN